MLPERISIDHQKKKNKTKHLYQELVPEVRKRKRKKKRNGHRERTVRKVRGETEGCL